MLAMIRLTLAALIVCLPNSVFAHHWAERDYQQALCDGMETEVRLPESGGVADCANGTHIIEVDWADKFKEGVGQVLTYAMKSDLIPGLILICRRSEASCLQHVLNAEETLSAVGFEAVIWRCGHDSRSLSDCLEVKLEAKP
jgi:hypothetical protein